MKIILFVFLAFLAEQSLAGFVHPMDFDGSKQHQLDVVAGIRKQVALTYCDTADTCQPTLLRMMERAELDAFKSLTKAGNRKLMDQMIRNYCDGHLGSCSYSIVWIMYKANLRASKQSLSF